jgi:hypothetical protein
MLAENKFPLDAKLPEITSFNDTQMNARWWQQDTVLIQVTCPACQETYQPGQLVCSAQASPSNPRLPTCQR